MRKIDKSKFTKENWRIFLENTENKRSIVSLFNIIGYIILLFATRNFWFILLGYFVLNIINNKIYDFILKHFFVSRCK